MECMKSVVHVLKFCPNNQVHQEYKTHILEIKNIGYETSDRLTNVILQHQNKDARHPCV